MTEQITHKKTVKYVKSLRGFHPDIKAILSNVYYAGEIKRIKIVNGGYNDEYIEVKFVSIFDDQKWILKYDHDEKMWVKEIVQNSVID